MKNKRTLLLLTTLFYLFFIESKGQILNPVRVVVAGTSHGHASWILNKISRPEMEIIGIYEPDKLLASQQSNKYNIPITLFYSNLPQVLDLVKPEAVVAFGSIKEHLEVVAASAPRGIHVMVEKPLGVNLLDAQKMEALAKKHAILLLTNFETSWYPSTFESFRLVKDSNYVGQIRKVVFHHGHQGPKEIGVGQEFLDWLTDPILNGAGALTDFGCYGANLMTYLMGGMAPLSVTAVTNQFKPNIYPKVDDDATIILNYPKTQAIIQASWNWPFSRKDMEIYGDSAYVIATNANAIRLKNKEQIPETLKLVSEKELKVYTDPFSYFHAVLRGKEKLQAYGLYTLENNMVVNRILEAAKTSAKTGKTIFL